MLLNVMTMANVAVARDPFVPPVSVSPCAADAQPLPQWRLRGIIGRPEDFHAWLVFAQGKWGQRKRDELLDNHWRVLQVDALSITVRHEQGCQPQQRIMLKGSLYDQDDTADTAIVLQSGTERPGSSVTGVR